MSGDTTDESTSGGTVVGVAVNREEAMAASRTRAAGEHTTKAGFVSYAVADGPQVVSVPPGTPRDAECDSTKTLRRIVMPVKGGQPHRPVLREKRDTLIGRKPRALAHRCDAPVPEGRCHIGDADGLDDLNHPLSLAAQALGVGVPPGGFSWRTAYRGA
jgi:hypothetical protein